MFPCDAIILCGGKGTRIAPIYPDIPKVLIPIAGRPYLWHCLRWLEDDGIQTVVLALGHLANKVVEYIKYYDGNIDIFVSIENSPLGTAGALRKAIDYTTSRTVLVMNGDTFRNIDLWKFYELHIRSSACISIAVKELNDEGRSAGIYLIERSIIPNFAGSSLEKDVFPNYPVTKMTGVDFVDFGKPDAITLAERFVR